MREPACWTILIGSSRHGTRFRSCLFESGTEALLDVGGGHIFAEGNAVDFADAEVDCSLRKPVKVHALHLSL